MTPLASAPSRLPEPSRKKKRSLLPTPRAKRWPDLEAEQILGWADAHYARTGVWPTADSGAIPEAPREKWVNVDAGLRLGLRGLQPGSSLARLLAHHRGVRNRKGLPAYTEAQILGWADAHHAHAGQWPTRQSGPVIGAPGETWTAVDVALSHGQRGLPGGSSLARLIAEHRGVRNKQALPLLDEASILAWADVHRERAGCWPTADAGSIAAAPGETWCAVNQALSKGTRGLPGGSSLARLLEKERGVPNRLHRPDLAIDQILAWADAHRARTGRWPTSTSGAVVEAPAERWSAIDSGLIQGNRQLPGDSSLARLLAEHRGAQRQGKPVRLLTTGQILAWVDAHQARTGRWPTGNSGAIAETDGESWNGVDLALARGTRGLPGGASLPQLLAEERGVLSAHGRPPLSEAEILAWADAHHAKLGRWPKAVSERIPGASMGETWKGADRALRRGLRGLPGGSSLTRLLSAERGVPNEKVRPRLSIETVLKWADRHHSRTGSWPTKASGPIDGTAGESWDGVDSCLRRATRGLPPGLSLPRLLEEQRGVRNRKHLPLYSVPQILAWADAYRARHGRWPRVQSGAIEEAPGETWSAVETALQQGNRGLPGGSTLHRLRREHRDK